jgi:hypothetical protein
MGHCYKYLSWLIWKASLCCTGWSNWVIIRSHIVSIDNPFFIWLFPLHIVYYSVIFQAAAIQSVFLYFNPMFWFSCGETAFKFSSLCEANPVSLDPPKKLPPKRAGIRDSVPTLISPRDSVCTSNWAYRKMMHEDCSAPSRHLLRHGKQISSALAFSRRK